MRFSELNFMVIDDMRTMRLIVKKNLKELKCTNVLEFENADSAWKHLETHTLPEEVVHFIICDWNMPGMKGVDLLRRVRKHDLYKDVAFVMVTGETEMEIVKDVLAAGVDGYVVKPFSPDQFRKKMAEVFRKRFATLKAG